MRMAFSDACMSALAPSRGCLVSGRPGTSDRWMWRPVSKADAARMTTYPKSTKLEGDETIKLWNDFMTSQITIRDSWVVDLHRYFVVHVGCVCVEPYLVLHFDFFSLSTGIPSVSEFALFLAVSQAWEIRGKAERV